MGTIFLSVLLLFAVCLLLKPSEAAFSSLPQDAQQLTRDAPKLLLRDFEYVPTKDGYRYSYDLVDGTRHEEIAIIRNPDESIESLIVEDASSKSTNQRQKPKSKSRKLALRTLQSLAG